MPSDCLPYAFVCITECYLYVLLADTIEIVRRDPMSGPEEQNIEVDENGTSRRRDGCHRRLALEYRTRMGRVEVFHWHSARGGIDKLGFKSDTPRKRNGTYER